MGVTRATTPVTAAANVAERLRCLAQITRLDSCVVAMLYTLLGAHLAAGASQILAPRALHASAVVFLVVAFGFVVNDYRDVVADRHGKPERPIPAGRVTPAAARHLSLVLAGSALLLASWLGPLMLAIALGTVLLSGIYSYYLKGTMLLGNAAMAVLNGSIVLYGALAVGTVPPTVWAAGVLILLYTFSQEILYDVEDEEGDARAGLRTTATGLGRDTALALYRGCALGFVLAALVPWYLGIASERYLYAVAICSVLPTLAVVLMLSIRVDARTIRYAVYLTWYVWFTSVIPIVLLRS